MGLMDEFKDKADDAKKFAGEHADKIADGIDKGADVVDDKTGGKYTDKIDSAAEKAKDALGKLD